MQGAKIKGTDLPFDPDFSFLLALDPAFGEWRSLAAEWWKLKKRLSPAKTGMISFLVTYLHEQALDKSPRHLLDATAQVPDLWTTLGWDLPGDAYEQQKHDNVSDFIDWVLREYFSTPDPDGHMVVPAQWCNPFQRKAAKKYGKKGDITFRYALEMDPRMAAWVAYAAEYMQTMRRNLGSRSSAVASFLTRYLIQENLPRDPLEFLKRTTFKPSFISALKKTASTQSSGNSDVSETPTFYEIKHNNHAADFIDWVLLEKLAVEGENGDRVVPAVFHNPIDRLSLAGLCKPSETVRNALPMLYIRRLRKMLVEGPTFRDWKWAQNAENDGRSGGEWFIVDPSLINRNDPDCVWRERSISWNFRKAKNHPKVVTEIWSPIRAVALYVKLELALRTIQVRFLDSGEGDTWRYVWDEQGGRFELNDSPFAQGCEARPWQRGVFHRDARTQGAGLFINTNKTADINKSEDKKGYVIPWTNVDLLFWLEKLRNWQERYNPVDAPIPWTELGAKYLSAATFEAILAERSPAFFLFRQAAAEGKDKCKPLQDHAISGLWYKILVRLEEELAKEKGSDALDNPIRLVPPDGKGTNFPLHSLRVSLITGLIMEGGLPIEIVSKLIAGHHSLIQTIYYTKIGTDHMNKLMAEAELKMTENEARGHKIFLMRHGRDEINQRFASVSPDGVTAAMSQQSELSFVFDDKGICPVGYAMCDVGGSKLNENASSNDYAPVPGYPHERNCIRCRFFLTGPAWLDGLNAKFNYIAYQAMLAAGRYKGFTEQVAALEERRAQIEATGTLFTEAVSLEKMSARLDAETESLDRWISDLQAIQRLINRCIEVNKNAAEDGLQLVAAGTLFDIRTSLTVTESELHPIEVQCRNATIYPEIDARQPTIRRTQLLDALLYANGKPLLFSRLSVEQQLQAGNAMMKLIESRAGSIENAVEFVEAHGRLKELGIVDDDLLATLKNVEDHGVAMTQIFREMRPKKSPPVFLEEEGA
jgi:hypothetical protein